MAAVAGRLHCEDFKRRMRMRTFFVAVADEVSNLEKTKDLEAFEWFFGTGIYGKATVPPPALDAQRANELGYEFLRNISPNWWLTRDTRDEALQTETESPSLPRLQDMGAKAVAGELYHMITGQDERTVAADSTSTNLHSKAKIGSTSANSGMETSHTNIGALPKSETGRQSLYLPPNSIPVSSQQCTAVQENSTTGARPLDLGGWKIMILRGQGSHPETLFPLSRLKFRLPVDMLHGTAVNFWQSVLCLPSTGPARQLNYKAQSNAITSMVEHRQSPKPRKDAVLLKSSQTNNDVRISSTFIIGGFENDVPTSTCQVIAKTGNAKPQWKNGPFLMEARGAATGARFGSCLYVIGGRNVDGKLLASVESMDEKAADKKWEHFTPIPVATCYGAAASASGTLFHIGGITDSSPTADTFMLTEKDPIWQPGPKLNYARAGHSVVALDGIVFAIGGYGDGSVSDDVVGCSIELLKTEGREGVEKENWIWELMKETLSEPAVHAAVSPVASNF